MSGTVKIVCLVLIVFLAALAFGQAEAGSISGTVRDPSGAVISGAAVTATNLATSAVRTAQTGSLGQYTIPGLAPGQYRVRITSPNFTTSDQTVEVTVGGKSTLDAQLTLGQSSTVVEVVAGGATEVNTQTQEVSQVIDTQQLAQLPSLNRNPYDFVAISGNVSGGDSTTPNMNGSQNQTGRGVGYAINGQRQSGTEILFDGVENVDVFNANIGEQIPVDSVQEYRVITNNFDAQYGRASGGVVNLSTKAGTNSFHGSAWEYNRLSAYTANTYANDAKNSAFLAGGGTGALPAPKGSYTRNQFGFDVGGPIVKNKLFFFESTEWTRVRSQPTETEETLDPAFLGMLPANIQNYFSAFGTGASPASGSITASQLAAAGLTIPNINGGTPVPASTPIFDIVNFKANFDAGGDYPQNTYRLVGRLDLNLTDRTQMFFRAGRESNFDFLGSGPTGNFYSLYPQYDVGYAAYNESFLYSLNHSFNVNVFSNTKLSFSRLNIRNPYNNALSQTPNLMLSGFPSDPVTGNLIQFPGLINEAPGVGGLPFGGPQNTIQLEHDLSWIRGRHSMRFGGQFTYIQLNKEYGAYGQAVEQLGNTLQQGIDGLVNVTGNPGGSPLFSYAARLNPNGAVPCVANPDGTLILTAACTVTPPLVPPAFGRSYRYKDWAVYAQDSFRVTPRLTLNYGLRYEHYGVQYNNNENLDSNFYLGSGSNIETQVRNGNLFLASQSPVGQFWAPDWGTVAPRVGFAWDIFGDGKTSLRGGLGASYERNFGNVTFNASFNPPASAVINSICVPNADGTTIGGPANPCPFVVSNNNLGPLGLPGPSQGLAPAELRMPNPHIDTAQTQFWSLALQREVARSTLVELGYSGAHGVHLYDIENINLLGAGQFYLGDPLTFPAFSACTTAATCLTRPNSQFSNINMRGSMGNSSYNALNLKLQTQNLHNTGLTLIANYTWSHSLDDLSSTFSDSLQGGSGAIGSLGYTDLFNPKLDWGSSDFDIRHRLVLSPIWETPWLKGGKGVLGQALGGWSLSGIFTIRTGIPFSVYDYTHDANGYTVPRLTPATPFPSYKTGSPQAVAPNLFNVLSLPIPASSTPLDPALGISDFGPFPADMMRRNSLRGPGAWNADVAMGKKFKITERVGLDFRAEGFDIFNHHNYYVNTSNLAYFGPPYTSINVTALKGGLGSIALGGNHDERRFGQFSLRVTF